MPKLVYHDSDQIERTFEIASDPVMVGRATECQVRTQDAMVSRRHARIFWDGGYWIEDLGSSNGVYVGGERITQRTPIRPGDEMRCGSLMVKLLPDVPHRMTGRMAPIQPPPLPMEPPPAPPLSFEEAADVPTVGSALGDPPPAPPMTSELPAAGASAELRAERAQRLQVEAALAAAEQRVGQLEEAAVENERLKRRLEQMAAELRRLRAPTGEQPPAIDPGLVATLQGECDRLRRRVAELEPTASTPSGDGDAALLRRKVEQLTAEIRRLRGGQPPSAIDEGRVLELEQRLAAAEKERDEAQRQAQEGAQRALGAPPPIAVEDRSAEVEKLQRTVDQLAAENRRLRQGESAAAADQARIADLTARLEKAEQAAAQAKRAPAQADPAVGDAASQLGDALNDLRGSLRAAGDEVGLLGVEAPGDSVTVLKDSLAAAHDQLELARGQLREIKRVLGVS